MRAYKKIFFSDDSRLNRIQDNTGLFLNQLLKKGLLDYTIKEDISLTTSATNVEHDLGRDYRGWILINKDANEDVWAATSDQVYKGRYVSLTASGTVKVSLLIF